MMKNRSIAYQQLVSGGKKVGVGVKSTRKRNDQDGGLSLAPRTVTNDVDNIISSIKSLTQNLAVMHSVDGTKIIKNTAEATSALQTAYSSLSTSLSKAHHQAPSPLLSDSDDAPTSLASALDRYAMNLAMKSKTHKVSAGGGGGGGAATSVEGYLHRPEIVVDLATAIDSFLAVQPTPEEVRRAEEKASVERQM
jgi:hypothetical protein